MERIVFLDASTVDYGDIDMTPLTELGDVTLHGVTPPELTGTRCAGASVVITNKVVIDASVMKTLPDLRMIAEAATGYNNIDIAEAGRRGIAVANVPGYSTGSVAQLTMTFILALSSRLIHYDRASHDGTWSSSPVFTLGRWPFTLLEGRTIGIMGYGAIGREVARLCRAFGMRTVALKRDDSNGTGDIERMTIDELAHICDFISIHMPLTDYSRNLVNREFLSSMKRTAFLVNMARGPIVDPVALLWALGNGIIAGAATDVMDREPPLPDDPLLTCENLIMTPHIGWASLESRTLLVREIAANVRAFIQGQRRNAVI